MIAGAIKRLYVEGWYNMLYNCKRSLRLLVEEENGEILYDFSFLGKRWI
jgi:hypothetical protein